MTNRSIAQIFASTAALLSLAACGGGGGGSGSSFASAPNPPPSPTPTPTPTPAPTPTPSEISLIKQVNGDIIFAGKGATTDGLGSSFSLADASQMVISYSAATNNYTVTIPGIGSGTLIPDPQHSGTNFVISTGGYLAAYASFDGLQYSNLVGWTYNYGGANEKLGYLAFGIPTAAGAVPVTGSASYSARAMGGSSETYFDNLVGGLVNNSIQGTMALAFNFGAGTLTGSLTAFLDVPYQTPLGTFAFSNTVYSSGSTSFSGTFASPAPGLNSFSGLFTGPAAQELIGNFQLPYISPVDGKPYQASGAFVGKRDGGGQ